MQQQSLQPRRVRLVSQGAALGALALLAGLIVVPPAHAEDPVPPTVEQEAETPQENPAAETLPAPAAGEPEEEAETPPAASAGGDDTIAPMGAGDGAITLTIGQQTGTEPFQDNDDPGNDSGADNDVVRTNDTVTYNLGIRYEGEDHTSPAIRFTVPRGQELVSLPPYCLPGSSVTPETLPDPVVPLTADSWQDLPTQEVTCLLKDETMGTSLNYAFVTQVRSEVPNGTRMDEVVFAVSSDQFAEPATTEPVSQTVSAAPRYDISKRMSAGQPNQGPLFQGSRACTRDSAKVCRTLAYPVTITVPAGGKGSTPLASPIVFEDNLDPESFYGADVWAEMVGEAGSESAAVSAYAPSFQSCTPITLGSGFRGSLPYSNLSYGDETNSVRDTGTLDCPATGPGENGVITITDTDTSAVTVPSTSGTGAALAGDLGYVVSFELSVQVPQDAVMKFGDGDDGTFVLDTHNEYVNVQMEGIDGGANQGDDPENNVRDASIRIQVSGEFDKSFTGIFGQDGNTPASDFSGSFWYEGSPGAGTRKDGNTVVMAGQAVQSVLSSATSAPAGTGTEFSRTFISCDVWDPSRLALAAHPDWQGATAQYPSSGNPVFPSRYIVQSTARPASEIGTADSGVKNVTIEYSSGPAGAADASDCTSGAWVDDPGSVPGATASTDALGRTVWQGVNRVRVIYNTERPAGTSFSEVQLDFAIGQVVLDSDSTDPIGNWASQVYAEGVRTGDEVIADPEREDRVPSYDPATHRGTLGDRLIQGEAIARVQKFVENPSTGEFTDQAVPQYTSGSTVRYRLNPTLSTSVAVEGSFAPVIIEDCLPEFQVFQSSTQDGNTITPELVQMGAPDDAELACGPDRQFVRWNLGSLAIGAPIEPITVSAEILEVARNGVFTNDVLTASPVDNSPAEVRSDDVQLQIVVPTGIKISKTVDEPEIEVNPDGVINPRSMTWSVHFANIDAPGEISDVDVIDVLPADGQNGSAFDGELRFESAAVGAGDGITILYTSSTALNDDPAHASNGASGDTVWCDAVAGGVVSGDGTAADCPQSGADVTGLRFQRPGVFAADDDFRVDIVMTPVGNLAGDVYRNITSGRADGVSQGVGPAARTVTVISSAVGDRVWEDLNANGIQDDGEPGVAGFPVRLVGTDVDGNPVDLSTTTDDDGLYRFDNLASGRYRVIFDPSGLNSNTTFTSRHEGTDPALDSDADPGTGETQEFALGRSSEDLSLDAGLVIDRNVDIVLDKKYLGATELDDDRRSTVTYELEAVNNGTASGPYDLTDTLLFGGDIEIGEVTVENIDPGGIETNPAFDGQTDTTVVSGVELEGGARHTYLVTVEATLPTTITTEESECEITETESGSGFLNSAELTMNGVTVTDKACGEPPVPPTTPEDPDASGWDTPVAGLPITGGQLAGGVAALAVLLLAAGAGALMLARRRRATASE